ncbi:MAG: SDR family NAD(P)-dependent oxidoreductase [Nitrososphaeria archaeon]
MRLKDKVSLITGSSRGIGRATALTFAREGADVIVNYAVRGDSANEVVSEIRRLGRRAIAIQADVSDEEAVNSMVKKSMEEFGKIDILVNSAGIGWKSGSILEGTREEWERVLGVNLIGTYNCIKAVAPYMIKRKYGKIVNISSIAGMSTAHTEQVAYGPSKAGIYNLTKRLAFKLGSYNICVNAIAPGLIKTDMPFAGKSEKEIEETIKDYAKFTSLGRVGDPFEIANVALFLASDESSFVTGQVIVADGGRFDYLSHSV